MLKFTCPECGKNRLEEVTVDVVQYSEITAIDEETSAVDYGGHNTDGGNVNCYQCLDCGYEIEFEDEEREEVNSSVLLVEWIKKNCPQ